MNKEPKNIILISCSSKKQLRSMRAKDIYSSTLFQSSLAYAYSLDPDQIYIISAKYFLLNLDDIIDPYNITLTYIPPQKRKNNLIVLNDEEKANWSHNVIKKLEKFTNLNYDKFIILAGKEYVKPLRNKILHLEDKLSGMKNGERVNWLRLNTITK